MKTNELIKKFEVPEGENLSSWLENQYPAKLKDRLDKYNYLNYQNIEDTYGKNAADTMRKLLQNHPEVKVLVLAPLYEDGRVGKKPRAFTDEHVYYYKHYELFVSAAHLHGFVELFHNTKSE